MQNRQNQIYYFGDLDYEGIGIYEKLEQLLGINIRFVHLCRAISECLKKAEGVLLPITKEQQNRNLTGQFLPVSPKAQWSK